MKRLADRLYSRGLRQQRKLEADEDFETYLTLDHRQVAHCFVGDVVCVRLAKPPQEATTKISTPSRDAYR